jgi:hypothetical protein
MGLLLLMILFRSKKPTAVIATAAVIPATIL